ncbi:MAG: anti-sigma factor [Pirellulaceae bacterium]
MMKRREIRELLDACQSDLHDLTDEEARALALALEQDPTLKDEWQAIQLWDAEIRRVFQDVPVPSGMAERLKAAVAAHSELPASPIASDAGAELPPVQSAQAVRPRWISRRTKVAAGILATSALLLIAAWLLQREFGWGEPLTAQQVVDASSTWYEQLDPEAWQSADAPLASHPLDPSVPLPVEQWQHCKALNDTHAVAYRAELPPNRSSAVLFVIRTRKGSQLPTFPPPVPDSMTGAFCVGVWKNNGCVYVLVIRGHQSDYQRAVQQSFA